MKIHGFAQTDLRKLVQGICISNSLVVFLLIMMTEWWSTSPIIGRTATATATAATTRTFMLTTIITAATASSTIIPKRTTTTVSSNNDNDRYMDSNNNNSSVTEPEQNETPVQQVLDFLEDLNGTPNDPSDEACTYNTHLLSSVLQNNRTNQNHIVRFPYNTIFYFYCGIYGVHMKNVTIEINGIVRFERHPDFPKPSIDRSYIQYDGKHTVPCFFIDQSYNITITSTNGSINHTTTNSERNSNNETKRAANMTSTTTRGIIDGQGSHYWGIPFVGYIHYVEHRPPLFRVNRTNVLHIENIIFQDSPYHTLCLEDVHNVHIHDISIVARRTKTATSTNHHHYSSNDNDTNSEEGYDHTIIDLTAFNTDGIDVSGTNVYVHDIDIWGQDDCIAVKDNYYSGVSKNMIFENINASGLGFVIGSIGHTIVSNITFRNSLLYKPIKGIYLKFHSHHTSLYSRNGGTIDTIVYDNITIYQPHQWPIWIGPAQQSDSRSLCHGNPCSLCWPYNTKYATCNIVQESYFTNITVRDVTIYQPILSPGVILGADATSSENDDYDDFDHDNNHHIDGIYFHNVQVINEHNPFYGDASTTANYKETIMLLQQLDVYQTFPGLQQPFHDRFVRNNGNDAMFCTVLIIGILLALIVLIIRSFCRVACCCIHKTTSCILLFCKKRNTKHNQQYHHLQRNTSITKLDYFVRSRNNTESTAESSVVVDEDDFDNYNDYDYDNNNNDDDERNEQHIITVFPMYQNKQQKQRNGTYDVVSTIDNPNHDKSEQNDLVEFEDGEDEEVNVEEENDVVGSNGCNNIILDKTTIIITGTPGINDIVSHSNDNWQRRCMIKTLLIAVAVVLVLCVCVGWSVLDRTNHKTQLFNNSTTFIQHHDDNTDDDHTTMKTKQQQWGRWKDTTQYYQCTGVVNGIASGTTWPVPSCFEDRTEQHTT